MVSTQVQNKRVCIYTLMQMGEDDVWLGGGIFSHLSLVLWLTSSILWWGSYLLVFPCPPLLANWLLLQSCLQQALDLCDQNQHISKCAFLMTPFCLLFHNAIMLLSFSHLSFDLITISRWFMQKWFGNFVTISLSMNLFEVTFVNSQKKFSSQTIATRRSLLWTYLK